MKKKFSWNCCSRRRWIISSFFVLVAVCGSITIFHNYVHNFSFVYSYVVLLHLRFVSVEFHTVEISYGEISYCKDLLRRSSIKAVTRIYLVIRSNHRRCSVFCSSFRRATLLKRNSNTGVFLWKLRKFLRTAVLKNICKRLLLIYAGFATTCLKYSVAVKMNQLLNFNLFLYRFI